MNMIKAAIFDLDSTLINTQKIKERIFDFIKDFSGFDNADTTKLYKAARSRGGEITFSLNSLEAQLRARVKDFNRRRWTDFVDRFDREDGSLIIAGAIELINFLKAKKIPIYILTLGVAAWQESKLRYSGLDKILGESGENIKFTTEERTERGKVKEIKEILRELKLKNCADIIFFNDRPDETRAILAAFPELRVIVRREKKDKRHSDRDFEELKRNQQVIKVAVDLNLIKEIKELL